MKGNKKVKWKFMGEYTIWSGDLEKSFKNSPEYLELLANPKLVPKNEKEKKGEKDKGGN